MLRKNQNDARWLAENADLIFRDIRSGLNRDQWYHDTTDLLHEAFRVYALRLGDSRRWADLLYDALTAAQSIRDNQHQMRVMTQMGEYYIRAGNYDAAKKNFTTVYKRALEEENPNEMRLAAQIGLLKAQYLRMDDSLNNGQIEDLIRLAEQVNDTLLFAELYQALALVFTYQGEAEHSINYGQIAYLHWMRLGDKVEMGRTLYRLAIAHGLAGRAKLARHLLKIAKHYFSQTYYPRQHALLAYEQGNLCLQRGHYDLAAQSYGIALAEFERLREAAHVAMARHALALAQIELEDFAEARENLDAAVEVYSQLENWHKLADAWHALGYLEWKAGYKELGYRYLEDAMKACHRLPDIPDRQVLEKLIDDTWQEFDEA